MAKLRSEALEQNQHGFATKYEVISDKVLADLAKAREEIAELKTLIAFYEQQQLTK